MNKKLACIGMAALFVLSATASAEEYTVGQKNKAFTESHLKVKVGDTVHFRNDDPFFHNVFSLSDTQFFDLGSYPKGESKSVTFEAAGTVEVECAIHPDMQMTIEVE
jgi:plastocyanin